MTDYSKYVLQIAPSKANEEGDSRSFDISISKDMLLDEAFGFYPIVDVELNGCVPTARGNLKLDAEGNPTIPLVLTGDKKSIEESELRCGDEAIPCDESPWKEFKEYVQSELRNRMDECAEILAEKLRELFPSMRGTVEDKKDNQGFDEVVLNVDVPDKDGAFNVLPVKED